MFNLKFNMKQNKQLTKNKQTKKFPKANAIKE